MEGFRGVGGGGEERDDEKGDRLLSRHYGQVSCFASISHLLLQK